MQDLRTSSGAIITLANQNGLRWSANDLVDKANNAIDETARLLAIFPSSPVARQLLENSLIVKRSLTFTSGISVITTNDVYAIIGLEKTDGTQEYRYESPARFRRIRGSVDDAVKDGHFFTVIRNTTTVANKEVWISPALASGSLEATILLKPAPLSSANFSHQIYFFGIDDFLLNVALKNCRLEENYLEAAMFHQNEILMKLGVNKYTIPRRGERNAEFE